MANYLSKDGLSYFLSLLKNKFSDKSHTHNNVTGATASAAGSAGLVPAPAVGQNNKPLCGDGIFKTLPIAGGGTGATTAAAARNALGLGNTSGALPVANGGTGATSAANARSNLGINSSIGINPVGTIIAYSSNGRIPDGYLVCDGSAISRTTYSALFSVISTLYGAGDGSRTFNLPNLIDRFIEGSSTAGNVIDAGLPNITGLFRVRPTSVNTLAISTDGQAFSLSSETSSYNLTSIQLASSIDHVETISFNASKSNNLYGKSTTVQPAAISVKYLIKY